MGELKNIVEGFYKKDHLIKRLIMVVLAVTVMGFSLSFLLLVNLGTDPCTMMNKAIAARIGMSIGNWQALLNVLLLIVVLIFGGRNLGFGTLANMFLVGYSIDFFSWLWEKILPLEAFQLWSVRIGVFVPAFLIFIFAAAVYMDVDLGTAPYDAIPMIVSSHLEKVPFKAVRIIFDFLVIGIGLVFGGKPELVTILVAAFLGPVIEFVGKYVEKICG